MLGTNTSIDDSDFKKRYRTLKRLITFDIGQAKKELNSGVLTSDSAVDGGDLLLDGHGDVLPLLQQLCQPHAAVQQLLRGSVEVGTELGERGHLAVLRELQLRGAGNLGDRGGIRLITPQFFSLLSLSSKDARSQRILV